MGWLADIVRIVADALGTTREWGEERAEVPWREIYESRRRVDRALANKHYPDRGDDDSDSASS